METKVKEPLPVLEELAQTPSHLVRPSVWRRAKAMGVRVVSAVLPQFPIPSYCHSCWARLEMVRDLPLERSDAELVKGVRFWTCPDCGQGASTRYAYLHNPRLWQDSGLWE